MVLRIENRDDANGLHACIVRILIQVMIGWNIISVRQHY